MATGAKEDKRPVEERGGRKDLGENTYTTFVEKRAQVQRLRVPAVAKRKRLIDAVAEARKIQYAAAQCSAS